MKEESFWSFDEETKKRLIEWILMGVAPMWVTLFITMVMVPSLRNLSFAIGILYTLVFMAIFLIIHYNERKKARNPLPIPLLINITEKEDDVATKSAVVNLLGKENKNEFQKFSEDKLVMQFDWRFRSEKIEEPDSPSDIEGMKSSAEEFREKREKIEDWVNDADRIRSVSHEKRLFVFFDGPIPLAFAFGNSLQNKKFYIGKWQNNRYSLLTLHGEPLFADSYELKEIKASCGEYLEYDEQIINKDGDPYTFNIYIQIGHHKNMINYQAFDVLGYEYKAKNALVIKRKGSSDNESASLSDIKLDKYVDYAICISNKIRTYCEEKGRCDRLNLFINSPVEITILLGYMLKPPPTIVIYHFVSKSKDDFYYSVLEFTKV